MTHIFVGKLTIIGSDNGLSPGQRQAIIWTNAGILLIGPLGTNFSEILIAIQTFSFKKMHLKICEMASILSLPQWVKYGDLLFLYHTVMAHERHGVWNHRSLDCLVTSLFGVIANYALLVFCDRWFPSQSASYAVRDSTSWRRNEFYWQNIGM